MARVINKLSEQINLNSDVKEIQCYEFKLQNAIQNISDIKAKLHEVVIDQKERENVLISVLNKNSGSFKYVNP